MEQVVERVSKSILDKAEQEIPATDIGQIVMSELRRLDDVAYVRFASVYRSFEDVDDFKSEIAQLFEKKKKRKKS